MGIDWLSFFIFFYDAISNNFIHFKIDLFEFDRILKLVLMKIRKALLISAIFKNQTSKNTDLTKEISY